MSKDKINIDQFFKNALDGAEGQADDASFLAIQSKLAQQKAAATGFKMYRLLYLLLIPCALFVYYLCSNGNNPQAPVSDANTPAVTHEENKITQQEPSYTNDTKGTDAKLNLANSAVPAQQKANASAVRNNNTSATPSANPTNNSTAGDVNVKDNTVSPESGKESAEVNSDKKDESKSDKTVTPENTKETESAAVTEQAPDAKAKAAQDKAAKATQLRQKKANNLIEVYGAAAISDRIVNADAMHAKYLTARNQADKQSVRYNAGITLTHNMGRISAGSGIGVRQFGQSGQYSITKNISDSVPVYDSLNHLKGYLYFNQRDTNYFSPYNNVFTNVEIPFHIDYTLLKSDRWDYRIGLGATINYLAAAKGALPNVEASGVVPLTASMAGLHRFGSSLSITNRIAYNIGKQWQVSSEIYYKHQITSLYKKSSGVREMPFDLGWRFGFGYKF